VNDVRSDNDHLPSHPQTRSELAVPIKLGERSLGVINVESLELGAFDKDDEHTLISLASYAAIAINNAQLYERTIRQAETLEGLYEAGKAITSTLAVDEVLIRIAEQALHIVGANPQEGCFSNIALCEGNKLKFIAASPAEMLNALNRVEIDLEKSPKKDIAGRAVLTAISQNVPDVNSNPDYLLTKENINSQLSVPLKIGEQIIGVLSIEHPKPAAFSDEDVMNVELLAAQAAVAIENAKQYRKMETTLVARTALAWTGMVSSTWQHAITRDTVTIRDQIELLHGDLANLSEDGTIKRRLEMVKRLANRILEKPITASLSAEEGAISIHLNALIRERANSLWTHDLYKPVKLDLKFMLEDSATVRASLEWVQRAMDILIDNAIDAMQGIPKPHLTISTRHFGNQAEILLRDNGHGIPVEMQERLFQKPIHKSQDEKGQGMGLLLAQTIIQTYGGEIRVKETGVRGTVMVISLPLED
jgi:GAF domain-containing protein